jgi:hypothetical protein
MPFGSQRLPAGTVASARAPIAASRPLQTAIACTVPMWFCTARRFGSCKEAKLGLIWTKRGRTERKYGARRVKA